MGKLGLSATEIGLRIGANAMEVNRLLKDQGFLYGIPSAYGLTTKGDEFGVQRSHDNGHHGSYNVSWDSTHFDPRILETLESSPEKLAKVREDIAADKQEQKAARKIAQEEAEAHFQAFQSDQEAAEAQYEIDPQKVLLVAVGVAVVVGASIGVHKGVRWRKRKKAAKAAQAEFDSDSGTSTGGEGK